MTVVGTCDDCGSHAVPLKYKPDVDLDYQTGPSVCRKCAYERDRMMREQREESA